MLFSLFLSLPFHYKYFHNPNFQTPSKQNPPFLFLSFFILMAMASLFLILLFLSTLLHACDARLLRLFESSRLQPSPISQEFQVDQLHRSMDSNNSDKASSMEIVGIEILKGMKKHKRLVMELPMKDKDKDKDTMVNSDDENEVGEDMVVMDYAQPHRRPPIHNEKP